MVEEIMDDEDREDITSDVRYILSIIYDGKRGVFLATSDDDNHESTNVWLIGQGRYICDALNNQKGTKYTFENNVEEIMEYINKNALPVYCTNYMKTLPKGSSVNIIEKK